ncbi:MAG: hypothetical protein DSZ12_04715 [Sulfurovum sp.]|nr:MAG: hypothetical protein DSZ08_07920 [Sulfurovum sp.]RUM74889.1 MAG: hypothetical protein DSZ12_04715 [Sulfurovum sp.]
MQKLLFAFLLLFSLFGCNDEKQQALHDAQIKQQAQAEKDLLLAQLQAKEEALQEARRNAKLANEKLLANEKAQKEAFIRLQEEKAKEIQKNAKLSNVGVSIKEHTITIDTNKTKDFFKNIGKNLENKLRKMTKDLDKGVLEDNNTGININQDHINIDLNKTKDFLNLWGKKMQGFIKDINTMAEEFDTQITPKPHN